MQSGGTGRRRLGHGGRAAAAKSPPSCEFEFREEKFKCIQRKTEKNSRRIKGRTSLAVNSKNEFIMYIRRMPALQRIDTI